MRRAGPGEFGARLGGAVLVSGWSTDGLVLNGFSPAYVRLGFDTLVGRNIVSLSESPLEDLTLARGLSY